MLGTLFKLKKYALHDGPGIRTTVFFKGCPLSCQWCHNPEGIDPRPQLMSRNAATGRVHETVGRRISVDELLEALEKDTLFYDESGGGVTFSGGEPLLQPAFLEALLKACEAREIHTALDTSGYAPAEVVGRIFPRVRLLLYDLKIMDAEQHRRFTGVSNRLILDNLKRAALQRVPLQIRVPIVPGVTDGEDNLAQIIRFVKSLKNIEGIALLPFHRIGKSKYERLGLGGCRIGGVPPTATRMAALRERFADAGVPVSIGG